MIKTSVIQIYGSAGCHTVICHAHLGVTEARCPLVDPHSIFNQSMIKGTCNTVNHFFIRDSRCNDPDINPPLCSKTQRMCHFIRNDQIWRYKPAVFFSFVDHADINFLSYLFIIHWTICIRLYKSVLSCLIF